MKIMLAVALGFSVTSVAFARTTYTSYIDGRTWSYYLEWDSEWDDYIATITGVSPASGDIEIPAYVGNDYSVEGIGEGAFSGCTGLRNVTFEGWVSRIGPNAFSGCNGLRSIALPEVDYIGTDAFYNCSALENFTAPVAIRSLLGGNYLYTGNGHYVSIIYLCRISFGGNCGFAGGYYASYGEDLYSLTASDGSVYSLSDIDGESSPFLCELCWKNKKFLGWYTASKGGIKVTDDTIVQSNMSLFAHYVAAWTVSFRANGGKFTSYPGSTHKRKVTRGKAVGALPKTTRSGYAFKGWYTKKSGGSKISSSTKIKKHMSLYAQWTAKKYTVKVRKTGSGTVSGGCKKAYKSTITLKAKPAKGYVFRGWYKGDSLVSSSATWKTKVPLNGATYTAVFAKKATGPSIGDGLDNTSLAWSTYGSPSSPGENVSWHYIASDSSGDGDCVQSGAGGAGDATSSLRTTIAGPCTISFRYKYQSYGGTFSLTCDSGYLINLKDYTSDAEGWKSASFYLSAGSHDVVFTYHHPGVGFANKFNGVRIDQFKVMR